MTPAMMNHRLADHVGVLNNSGPGPMSVYKTAAVGAVWRVHPQMLIRELLAHRGLAGGHLCSENTIKKTILHPPHASLPKADDGAQHRLRRDHQSHGS